MANAVSNMTGPIDQLFWITVAGSIAVGGFVFCLMIYFLYKYKENSKSVRNHVKNELRFEKLWLGFAIVLIVILVVVSTPVLYSIEYPANTSGATVINVEAHQWYWNVTIPSENLTTYCNGNTVNRNSCNLFIASNGSIPSTDSINLKVGKEYELNITSGDVDHSFFVYDLSIKVDAIPGQANTRFFSISNAGTYVVTCAEFCGVNHYQMQFDIIAK